MTWFRRFNCLMLWGVTSPSSIRLLEQEQRSHDWQQVQFIKDYLTQMQESLQHLGNFMTELKYVKSLTISINLVYGIE